MKALNWVADISLGKSNTYLSVQHRMLLLQLPTHDQVQPGSLLHVCRPAGIKRSLQLLLQRCHAGSRGSRLHKQQHVRNIGQSSQHPTHVDTQGIRLPNIRTFQGAEVASDQEKCQVSKPVVTLLHQRTCSSASTCCCCGMKLASPSSPCDAPAPRSATSRPAAAAAAAA
jgi:hypothetical protein